MIWVRGQPQRLAMCHRVVANPVAFFPGTLGAAHRRRIGQALADNEEGGLELPLRKDVQDALGRSGAWSIVKGKGEPTHCASILR
ncbi:hypothetical protein D9M68_914430 [compost metagenome]